MRRRIVIGGVVIIGLGVLAFALSGPKKGSIEWHKAEWRAASYGRPFINRIRPVLYRVTGHTLSRTVDWEAARRHEQALIELGYWEKRVFVLSNREAPGLCGVLLVVGLNVVPNGELFEVRDEGTNRLCILAMPRYMPQFEVAVGELDVNR